MNNNFYNIPVDWYKEFNKTFVNPSNVTNNLNNTFLLSPKEGFLRGNMFSNLYDSYKNYQYGDLSVSNGMEELLYNILKYQFALTDLNLYLDLYPDDKQYIELYNKYLMDEKRLCEEYEMKYGPLTLNSKNINDNTWDWIKSPWPWEAIK